VVKLINKPVLATSGEGTDRPLGDPFEPPWAELGMTHGRLARRIPPSAAPPPATAPLTASSDPGRDR
jgi:hypothetical protein